MAIVDRSAGPAPSRSHPPARLSGGLVAVMAVATGAIVANLYYAQPLLHEVARTFGVGSAAAAAVITCTQVGYAAGLVLVVPLGDLHPRRPLVLVVYCVAAVALVAARLAPDPVALRGGLGGSRAAPRWPARSWCPSPPTWPRPNAGAGWSPGS